MNKKQYRNMTINERVQDHQRRRALSYEQIGQAKNSFDNQLKTTSPKTEITFKTIIKDLEK